MIQRARVPYHTQCCERVDEPSKLFKSEGPLTAQQLLISGELVPHFAVWFDCNLVCENERLFQRLILCINSDLDVYIAQIYRYCKVIFYSGEFCLSHLDS